MATISLRVPEEELAIFKDYARIHNMSLSSVIRNTMMERIENEYDYESICRLRSRKRKWQLKNEIHQ